MAVQLNFFDSNSLHYHDMGWEEGCNFNAIYGPNGWGIPGGGHGGNLSLPYLPPPLNCDICQTANMGYYFSGLGFSGTSAPTLTDFAAMSSKCASYNANVYLEASDKSQGSFCLLSRLPQYYSDEGTRFEPKRL